MKYRRTTIRTAIAGAGFAALILTSCSSPDTESQPTVTETVTVTPSPIPSITDPESSGTGSLTARPEGPPVLAFGERFDYSDGVTVQVTNVGTSYISTGAESSGGQVVELELAITNNTEAAFDPTGADGTLTYGAQGEAADEVFSQENGWSGGYFVGTLLPGRTATVNTAYAVPSVGVGDLVFEFTPEFSNWERGAVIYVSQP